MPTAIHPMLATSVDEPFDDPEWLFEIKWDGYRAIAFIAKGKVRLVSRNQNDLTAQYPELHSIPAFIKAETAILDGEIAALDEQGRSSFSLMQQRTGIRAGRTSHRLRAGIFPCSTTSSICSISTATICGGSRSKSAKNVLAQIARPEMARSATPIIFPRARRCSMRPSRKGWKAFWPSAGTVSTKSAAPASGSRSKLPRPWIASSADTPIPKAAVHISARSCWASMTRREN